MEKPLLQQGIVKAALYMRLSRDDEQAGDSESIQNQRDILRAYAQSNGMVIAGEYVDDGWSGTNFNRPDFRRMIADIESGKINCVITKDLSRLGRNYIEVGQYTDYYFPKKGVRYIAISDRVDTWNDDNDVAPFLNIFNEFHAKQTSKKTRAVFESKFKNGMNCHSILPYGYCKDPEHKGRILIHPEQAEVVRTIFDMADSGIGSKKISKWLYDHRIECPGYELYKAEGKMKKQFEGAPEDKRYSWNITRIKKMLRNEYYIGNSVHYRERTASFKDKTRLHLQQDRWMVVENTHEAIIPKDQFLSVQRKMDSRYRTSSGGFVQVFSGIARCADCGKLLRFNISRYKQDNAYMYLMCPGKKASPRETCTAHYIRYDALKQRVLEDIQALIQEFHIDRDALMNRLMKSDEEQRAADSSGMVSVVERLQLRKDALEAMFRKLYEDWAGGKITDENFNMMVERIQQEQRKIGEKLDSIHITERAASDEEERFLKFSQIIQSITSPQELTRELVNALIDRIEVHESEGKKGSRNKKQVVDIYYKFIGATR